MSEESPFDDADDAESGDETDVQELFDDVDLEGDDEDVWAELADGSSSGGDGELFDRLAEENPTDQRTPDVETDGEDAVVPKNRFCQRCEFFTKPPEVGCLNPGTEIVEVVDSERFRVQNCPVVEERQGVSDVLDME